jgi:predicted TIM-barrel fold metal-dependent hydrolase
MSQIIHLPGERRPPKESRMPRQIPFRVFDADTHLYEARDAFTRYLPREYDGLIRYVEINGRTKLAIKNKISDYIPNPTFDVVAPPGAYELKYKRENPDSATPAANAITMRSDAGGGRRRPPKPGDRPREALPRSIPSIPAFFEPGPRLEAMDELGIDKALLWPTLASVLEERMVDDPIATHVLIHAFNEWLAEQWSFNHEDRIFPAPVLTLPIVDRAIAELEWVVERGARVILIRPAPVPDFNGRRRSFALPEFDPFWKAVQDADILVGLHGSDSGFQRYLNEYEGRESEYLPFKEGPSAFSVLVGLEARPIADVVTSVIGHGLATRFPKLRFLPVENGSSWVPGLLRRFEKLYSRSPTLFEEDPVVAFKRCVWVHPFPEEDPLRIVELVGIDNVCFGSDYPHPEGMFDPLTYTDEIESLPTADQAKIMGGNLAGIMRVAAW